MAGVLELLQLKPLDIGMILICVGLFAAYWQLSEWLLFKPLLELFQERERLTTGAQDSAVEIREKAKTLARLYDEAIETARTEAVADRLKKLAEASKRASSIVSEAETAAKTQITDARKELQAMETSLRQKLSSDSQSLAKQLAERILQSGSTRTSAMSVIFGGVLAAVLSLGILANPEAALASSGAGHVPSFRDTFIYWPNFIVFLGVMYFLLRKPFVDYWQTRAETIADALNAGRRAREEAQFELSQAESRYARVDEEVKGLIARIATESDAEAAKIVTDAEARARKITERAEQSRIAERNSLEIRLREELAESVVSEAQRILKNELSSASGEGREKDKALRAGALTGVSNILQ